MICENRPRSSNNNIGTFVYEYKCYVTYKDEIIQKIYSNYFIYSTTYHRRTRKFSIPYRECVESSRHDLILGDAFFRRWLVLHDLSDLRSKRIALAPIYHSYSLGAQGADTGGAAGPGGWVVQKLLARKNLGGNAGTHSQKYTLYSS